jgi:hypothetical protein
MVVSFAFFFGDLFFILGFSFLTLRCCRRMAWSAGGIWTTEVPLQKGQEFSYKYCILDDSETGGGVPQWEPCLERTRVVPKDEKQEKLSLNDFWGVQKSFLFFLLRFFFFSPIVWFVSLTRIFLSV